MIRFHGAKINGRCEDDVTMVLQSCYKQKISEHEHKKSASRREAGCGHGVYKGIKTYSLKRCEFILSGS